MARRRYQRGSLTLSGKRNPAWVGRWLERVIEDGEMKTIHRSEVLGDRKQYPTKRLAMRALEKRIADSEVNNISYRPRPVAKFSDFAEKWKTNVLEQEKPSCKAPERSRLKKHLLPMLGDVCMKDINTELLQACVTHWSNAGLSPKTIRNLIAQLSSMWNSAQAWEYVGETDPFKRLRLPAVDETEQPVFVPEDARRIIAAAEPPYDTAYWLVAQTGIRRGELCALDVSDFNSKWAWSWPRERAAESSSPTTKAELRGSSSCRLD
jgi:integrase